MRKGKPVIIEGITYPSVLEASRKLGYSESTLRRWVNSSDCTVEQGIKNHTTRTRKKRIVVPVEPVPDVKEILKQTLELWKRYHLIPNMNSSRVRWI